MRQISCLLAFVAISASAALAQSGFSTQTYTAGQDAKRPNQLQSADFNRDGKPDVLEYAKGYPATGIVFNDGNGNLNGGGGGLVGGNGDLGPAQTGDMNGDGAPDVVGCAAGSGPNQSNLEVYLNNGTGKLSLAQTIALPGNCTSVNLGDENKDGHLDVIVTTISGTNPVNNMVQTFPGDGTGQVGSPTTQQNVNLDSTNPNSGFTNCSVIDATGGDFFGDGTYSLIVNTQCNPPSNPRGYEGTTFLGNPNGIEGYTFTELREGYEALEGGKTFDVNKDGKPDAIFVTLGTADFDNVDLIYAQNNGGGSFTFHSLLSVVQAGLGAGTNVYEVTGATVADFNHDGINDIAVAFLTSAGFSPPTNTEVAILNGSSSGTFTESQMWMLGDSSTSGTGDITSADFNGDGYPDLATLSYNPSNGYTTLYEYLNTPGDSTSSCALPAKVGTSVICQPANGSTVNAPVVVTAASNEPGFTLNRLYLDGVALYQNPAQSISTQIAASLGSHMLVLVSYNNQGQAVSSSTSFDVGTGGGGACLPSGPSAKICEPDSGANVNSPVAVPQAAEKRSNSDAAVLWLHFFVAGMAVLR